MDASRAKFDSYLTTARWLTTRAPQWLIPFWYSREPMFWLPHGWFPYYAEWFLSLPRAPLGSVSIASWQVACAVVIDLVVRAVRTLVGWVQAAAAGSKAAPVKEKVKVGVPAAGESAAKGSAAKKQAAATAETKEL